MPTNYLFLPIPNVRGVFEKEPEINDAYLTDGIEAFEAVNPDQKHLLSKKKLSWTEVKSVEKMELAYAESFAEAKDRLPHEPPGDIYLGTLRHDTQEKQLSGLGATDVLFVLGHGNWATNYLCRKDLVENGKKSNKYMIHGSTLAAILQKSGLPKDHKWIKLNACFGGGSDAIIPFNEASLQGGTILARLLAVELGKLGYKDVQVGAYSYITYHDHNDMILGGCVAAAKGPYVGFEKIESTRLTDAYKPREVDYEEDPYRVWYDSTGDQVRWNEPDLGPRYIKPQMLDAQKHPEVAEHMNKVKEWEQALAAANLG